MNTPKIGIDHTKAVFDQVEPLVNKAVALYAAGQLVDEVDGVPIASLLFDMKGLEEGEMDEVDCKRLEALQPAWENILKIWREEVVKNAPWNIASEANRRACIAARVATHAKVWDLLGRGEGGLVELGELCIM